MFLKSYNVKGDFRDKMDSSLGQVFQCFCLAMLLSYVSGSVCNGNKMRLRGPTGLNCDGLDRSVEILCDDKWVAISYEGNEDISSAICRRFGCDGGRKSDQDLTGYEVPRRIWRGNCADGNEFSLRRCNFTRAESNVDHWVIVNCNDGTNMLITIDIVESVLMFVAIVFTASLLYHLALWKIKSEFKEKDLPESQVMLSPSDMTVRGERNDESQPDTTRQEETELEGVKEKFVGNICYEATTEKAEHCLEHDTAVQENKEPGQIPEFVDNVCYEPATNYKETKEKAEPPPKYEADVQEDAPGQIPELVENVCYEATTYYEGATEQAVHPPEHETDLQGGTEIVGTHEVVQNVCYESFTEKEQHPYQSKTDEKE